MQRWEGISEGQGHLYRAKLDYEKPHFKNSKHSGDKESRRTAQLVTWLLYKHKNMSFTLRTHVKLSDLVVRDYNPWAMEVGDKKTHVPHAN